MEKEIIEVEYRRGLEDGIYRARFWENGDLILEKKFVEEFRRCYSSNGSKPKIEILYGGVTEEEAVEFKRRLEVIASNLNEKNN